MAADAESTIRIGIDTTEALASIKKLQAQISAFHTQLQSSGNAANAAISDNLQRGLIKNLNATGQFAASLTTVKSSAESFTTALEKNKLSMGEYFRYAGGASKTFGRLFRNEFDLIEKVARERVKTVNTQFIKMGRDANGAITAIKVRPLVADLESLAGKQAIAAQRQQVLNQLLKQGSTNLLNFGKNTQWAGRQLMVGFTIPLAYLGTVAGKTFMKMEEQALRFKRVYGELTTTSDETDRMVKDIQRLANEYTKYGVAVEKTMELAADAAAMGKMGSDLTAQVAQATRLAVLGNVEQAQALETTIAMTNAFGTASEDLAKKIDFLNAVENQTVTSIEDLTIAIPKAGPVIQQLGGDVEDLAFFLTAMKEGGINASEGANALKSGLASLINPTEKAAKFMEGFGINLKGIVESNKGDVKGIVLDFAKALDTLDPLSKARSIEQLFGKFQFARLSTLFQNVIAEGNQASRVLKLTRNATEELAILSERELKRVEESTGYKFKKALEDLKASLIPLGEQFLKIITPIAEFATKVLGEFNKLSDGTKSVITTIVTVLGGIGPVALMTFGLLANGVANIIKLFTTIRTIFSRFSGAATGAGASVSYMTQEQLEASAVAASLNQTHAQLIQTFTLEKTSIDSLTKAYERAIIAQGKFNTGAAIPRAAGKAPTPKKYNSGVLSVPGPKGAGDIIPAMLAPGEAVIPADAATKYRGFIADMIAGKIPGFFRGFLGMPRSGKSTIKNREAATDIYENFKRSSFRDVEPENYGHQITPTSGHSFPVFGLGGVYTKADGSRVFVKPVMDETAAIAEIRATEIARRVHGLEAPEQRIVVMRDPSDVTRQRRFLALESPLNPNLVNDNPVGQFTQEQYFRQLVASLLRADKDLSPSNLFGNVLADVGPAGVFTRASGVRNFTADLPSMEQQAMINLLAVKGGAKRAFAESTVGLMSRMTPQQYHDNMIAEIKRVLPSLKKTVDSFEFSSPEEALAYTAMVKRLEDGLNTDWSKFHAIHSAVVPTVRKSNEIRGYNDGVISVPGPKGKGDIVPAMLAPGEAVIPAKAASKYRGFIAAMIAGKIPGFLTGIENVGQKDRDFINNFAQKYSSIPELEPVIQKTIDRMNAEGIRITQANFRAELKKDSGRLFELANTTARVSPTTGDSSAMTGLNATHGNAPISITPDMARTLASQVGEDSGFGRRLLESAATGKNSTAMSNLVFGMPSAFNRQEALMSGTDSAAFVKKFPELFMEPIVKMYARTITGLSGDKLGVNQFAEIISKKLAKLGKKAVTEQMFYAIVKESIAELKKLSPKSPALKALEKARDEFRVIQYGGGGGRRGELTKGLAFNARGEIVPASGAPNYRGDASRAAIAGGTAVADNFAEQVLARALKAGTYLPNIEDSVTQRSPRTAAAVAKKEKAKAAKAERSGARSKSREVKPKKFPGGFDINRVSSVISSNGQLRYYYLNEDGKKVPLGRIDYTEALGISPSRLKEIEQMALAERAQEASVTPKRGGGLGKAAAVSALAIGGVGLASNMMPQGGQQQEGGGIDLMTAAIVGSTVASIPMMFGQTIPQFLKSIGSFASKLPGWAKVVGLLATAIAPFIPQIIKAFTPLKDTEEYANAFNEGLVNNRAQLDAIATTFGKVASADIFERVRQNKFLPLEYAPGQTPFGDTFAASEQGKAFVEEYKKALSDSGPQAAVQKLSQELSYQIVSGIFTVDQAKSIAMTIGQQLDDMSIGINVSAKLTELLGPDGKRLENQTGDVLSGLITTSGQPLQTVLDGLTANDFVNDMRKQDAIASSRQRVDGPLGFLTNWQVDLTDSLMDGIFGGLDGVIGLLDSTKALDASELATIVSATMSTIEGGRQALATFELIYDEKEATVQKEIDHARAIKDTAAEAKALEKLENLQKKRAEERVTLQESFAKQLQATQDIYTRASDQGRSDILGGFMDQFTNLYKDTPMADVATSIKEDLERLKDNPFVVNIAAALATGAIKPESFNALLTGLDGKPLETNILANVSSVIKTQGTQAGGELINLLNKLGGRSDLQLTLTMLVQQDSANLDALSLLGTLPGGGETLEFYLDPKVNPNNLEDLNTLKGNLGEIDNLIQSGDFNMEKLLELDLNLDETQMNVLKENAEWFDKLPDKQKKVFTSVFMSILPTITNEQIDAAMAGEVDTAVGDETNPLAADRIAENTRQKLNTPQERARIAAKLAADQAKAMIDYLDLTDGSNNPQTPTDGGKGQVTFLDSLIRKVRDLYKSTQKLTTGWQASSKAILELGKNLGEAFAGRGLAERLREAGVTESLIPGLLDLKANNPEEFAKLFKGGKVSGGLNELGQTTNNLQIATAATESFAEAQSRSARVSIQNQTALTRLLGLGVSYSDALVMLQDENFAAMVATGRFNDEVKRQIGLFNDAKAAAAATAQGMTDEFKEAYDLAMERFAAEEAKIDIQLEIDTAADQDLIAKVQEQIALINDQNDDLDYGLTIIADQEEDINKEYDDRLEALDEVEKANKRIASLQSKQIGLAQAIAEGDVFAAAKAMQELEAANAEAFAVDSRDMLERERAAKLEQATAEVMVDGVKKKLTRLEIEDLIKNNLKAIAKLEEEQLEPAEARVRKATALAEETKRGLTIAGDTKAEWEKVGNEIDLARLDVIAYDGKLGEALTSVESIVKAWKDVKAAQDEANGGVGGKDGNGKDGNGNDGNGNDGNGNENDGNSLTFTDTPIVPTSTTETVKELNPAWTSQNKAVEKAEKDLKDLKAESAEVSNTIASLEKQIKDLAGVPGMSTVLASLKKELAGKKTHLGYLGSSIVSATTAVSKEKAALAKIEKYKTTTVSGGGGGTPLLALATGGFVSGPGTPTSDSIPAMLSNGEYVINAKTTREIGTDILDAINFGKAPGFAVGGRVNVRDLMAASKAKDNAAVQKRLAEKAIIEKQISLFGKTTSPRSVEELRNNMAQKFFPKPEPKQAPRPGDASFYKPASTTDAIGKGMQFVMDNVYRGLFGQAALNAKYGVNVGAGDIVDSVATIGLNALPIPAVKSVAGTAKFSKAVKNSLDKDYVLNRTVMRDTLPPIPGVPPMKVTPYQSTVRVNAHSPRTFYENLRAKKSGQFWTMINRTEDLPLRGFEDYSPRVQNFMGKMLGNNLPYRIKRVMQTGAIEYLDTSNRFPGLMAIPQTLRLRHRSTQPLLEDFVTHPSAVPVSSGRFYGPGTYFAKDAKTSKELFSSFGDNVYMPKMTPRGIFEIAKSKGYLKLGEHDLPNLRNMEWNDPFIQDSLKQGYIGVKHGDAYTNWLTGTSKDFGLKKVPQLPQLRNPYAMGGLVKPAYFNYGGMVKAYAKGGDVVPSMLTPGEFVMSKYAVQNYGVDKMKALNSGTYNGDSVYNYNLSVNVTSDANPDDIARTVMTQIRQIESQRIRSAR